MCAFFALYIKETHEQTRKGTKSTMLEQSPGYIKLTASTSQASRLPDEPNSPKVVNTASQLVLETVKQEQLVQVMHSQLNHKRTKKETELHSAHQKKIKK